MTNAPNSDLCLALGVYTSISTYFDAERNTRRIIRTRPTTGWEWLLNQLDEPICGKAGGFIN